MIVSLKVRHDIYVNMHGDMLNYVNDMIEAQYQKEHFLEKEDSGPDHLLDGVSGQGVEEHGEEEGEEDDEDDLEDRPLVVVPDDVPDRLQRVEEPHERRVRSPGREKAIVDNSMTSMILSST